MNNNVFIHKPPYFIFEDYLSFSNMSIYFKYLNILMERFDLYQMDNPSHSGLKVYFPHGFFEIILIQNEDNIRFKLILNSKNKKKADEMKGEVLNVYNYVRNLFES